MYVNAPHIQEFVVAGDVYIVGAHVARQFSDFLDTLPWGVSRQQVDWDLIAHHEIDLDVVSEDELVAVVRSTRIGEYERLLFLYAPDEPAAHCALDFGLRHFDQLYWLAPGPRYMCGASVGGGAAVPVFDTLIDFDGASRLRVAA
jgi:hypothetical protein